MYWPMSVPALMCVGVSSGVPPNCVPCSMKSFVSFCLTEISTLSGLVGFNVLPRQMQPGPILNVAPPNFWSPCGRSARWASGKLSLRGWRSCWLALGCKSMKENLAESCARATEQHRAPITTANVRWRMRGSLKLECGGRPSFAGATYRPNDYRVSVGWFLCVLAGMNVCPAGRLADGLLDLGGERFDGK